MGFNGDVNVVGGLPVYSAAELSALTNLDDGEEAYLQADALDPATLWRLRYNAGASSYPWQFAGGAPVIAEVTTTESLTAAGNGNWRAAPQSGLTVVGPKITLPLVGWYEAQFGAMIDGAAAGTKTAAGLVIDGTDPTGSGDPWVANYDTRFESVASIRRIEVTGAGVVEMKYLRADGTGATAQFSKRWLHMIPVQIG